MKEHTPAAAPPAGWGPHEHAPPAVPDGGAAPAHAPRPAGGLSGWSWGVVWIFLLMSICANALEELSTLTKMQSSMIAYCVGTVLAYWTTPKPRRGFLPWAAQVVGLFLNFYVGLVTVPESLRGLLPEALAYGLPAFVVVLLIHWAPPLLSGAGKRPLWQSLILAAAAAAFWGWKGAALIR